MVMGAAISKSQMEFAFVFRPTPQSCSPPETLWEIIDETIIK
jgi:hypothetical protein